MGALKLNHELLKVRVSFHYYLHGQYLALSEFCPPCELYIFPNLGTKLKGLEKDRHAMGLRASVCWSGVSLTDRKSVV